MNWTNTQKNGPLNHAVLEKLSLFIKVVELENELNEPHRNEIVNYDWYRIAYCKLEYELNELRTR